MRNGGADLPAPLTHTLEVDSVQLAFGTRRVLQSIYLKVETGCVTGLVGRNGSGKSCLMRILSGNLDIVEKSVRIDSRWIDYGYKHGVVYAPQHSFIPGSRRLKQVMRDYDLDFEGLVARFPAMEPCYSHPMARLSGGERRILDLYIVLASQALFCLLDEPFSQLSPLQIEAVKGLIAEQKAHKGILVSDHLCRDICAVSDRLYLIAQGTTRPVDSQEELQRLGYAS